MSPILSENREGRYSLQELLWESDRDHQSLRAHFERYAALKAEREQRTFHNLSDLIISNCLASLYKKAGVLPTFVFVNEFNRSLKLLFVFRKADYDTKGDDIYRTLPRVQDAAISRIGRDFSWHAMSDEGFEVGFPLSEFDRCLYLQD